MGDPFSRRPRGRSPTGGAWTIVGEGVHKKPVDENIGTIEMNELEIRDDHLPRVGVWPIRPGAYAQ